jgi:hypothetical protein
MSAISGSTQLGAVTASDQGESGLAGHRSPRLRPAHLEPDAVVIRAAAGGRTQDAAPATARHRQGA